MVAETTAYSPMPAHLLLLREKTLTNNGIHTIYPLGQDYGPGYYGVFSAYENFVARVFGYLMAYQPNYEWAVYGYAGYAILKVSPDNRKCLAILHGKSGYEWKKHGQTEYQVGMHYSFAIRAVHGGYQLIETETGLDGVDLPYEWMKFMNYNQGNYRQLSTHFGDLNPDAQFPVKEGLGKLLHTFVRFDVGSYLVYTGIYMGNDPIRVKDVEGAVGSLGRPSRTGIFVRIGIRVTTRNFVFTTDYGALPVVADFEDLVKRGFNYIPRFQPSFNVRHVLIESTRYAH